MNIIFLDIDGVLNDSETFNNIKLEYDLLCSKYPKTERIDNIDYLLERKKLELDLSKLLILKNIVDLTNSKIVLISSWINTKIIILIEDYFNSLGIPIEGKIDTETCVRGIGIKKYLEEHKVDNYLILDDEIFDTYDDELKYHLIHTNFYNGGLQQEHVDEAIYRLRKK